MSEEVDDKADDVEFINVDGLAFTPREHERLKSLLHGERFRELAFSDRRYLVLGTGGDTKAADRRMLVDELLGGRPDATAFRLEDFELTTDELALWAAAYENLCGRATQIVLVIEDYEGGYVWELGYHFHEEIREKVWVLKREYGSKSENRAHYDNGMAASHLQLLENAERTILWRDREELEAGVSEIP
ncbi:aminopeptidase [Natronorarus salvus]|uniref:aminopeptidase n=1 Tax=Natronorarus salvus TaxID=3117733 RepID=UPI002F26AF6C